MSTNTGSKPEWMIDAISDDQVKVGTITFPPFGYFNFKSCKESKFAEEPELTKTLYLTPSHFDQ